MVKVTEDVLPALANGSVFLDNCPDDLPSPEEVLRHDDVLRHGVAAVVRFRDRRVVVKHGGGVCASEFYAHWLVWTFSSARTPAVYAWIWDASTSRGYLYMELIDGVALDARWPDLSADDQRSVARSLRAMMDDVRRTVEPPNDWYIGSVPRMPCVDPLFSSLGTGKIGPCFTLQAFHDRLVRMGLYPGRPALPNDPQDLREVLPDDARVVFSHGNLHFSNILVSPPGEPLEIRAIIDWESGGFYPDYWEWIQMMMCEGRFCPDRVPFIDLVCQPRPEIWQKWDTWLEDLHL